MKSLNEKSNADIKNSNFFWLERTPESTVEVAVTKVEKHPPKLDGCVFYTACFFTISSAFLTGGSRSTTIVTPASAKI